MVNQIGQDRRAHFIMYMLHLLSPGHGKRITLWYVLQWHTVTVLWGVIIIVNTLLELLKCYVRA